jgi:cytoskeletal protein CcmA (bactofilin family)
MFNKTANNPPPARPQPAPAPMESAPPRRPAPARAPSLLGADLVFQGQISGDGELHVEGVVKGEVTVARLVVGERATIEGQIRGGSVEVRGKVLGNIEAKAVKLYESAHVEGDIVHEQLSIDVGAFFQGRCQQARPAPAPAAAAPAPAPAPAAQAPAAAPQAAPAQQPAAKVVELEQAKG